MNQTISYYDKHAEKFCRETKDADMSFCRDKFLNLLEQKNSIQNVGNNGRLNIHILDAGCGSARDAKAFLDAGYQVTAMDASIKICEEAEKLLNKQVLCLSFEELVFKQEFHGIWACASLLHVSYKEIDDVLKQLWNALKKDGILYASFKYGDGERVVKERFFYDYNEVTLKELMIKNGFYIEDIFMTQDVREDRKMERWINVLAGKEH